MELLRNNNDILQKIVTRPKLPHDKIVLEMTINDFLSFYLAKITVHSDEFDNYSQKIFPNFKEDLFLESVSTEKMEEIIDELNIPHTEWLI